MSDAPATSGADSPHSARTSDLDSAAIRSAFRRNAIDRQDPFETSGEVQHEFTVNGSYKLPAGTSAQQLADEIRAEIHTSLVRGAVAGAEVEIVDFDDARMKGEPPRRFVVVKTKTARKTPANVNAYFQPYGEHLFYSVRSYTVPRLSMQKLFHTLGILLLLFGPWLIGYALDAGRSAARSSYFSGPSPSFGGAPTQGGESFGGGGAYGGGGEYGGGDEEGSGGLPVKPLLMLAAVVIAFRKTLRNLLARDSFAVALRKQFPGELSLGTFDDDDIIAFLKTNLDLTLEAITKVLERHGIDTKALRTIIQNLQTFNVNTGGGGITGAVFGGTGNTATGTVDA